MSFTIVAISILIIRYVPPDEVPLPTSLLASTCGSSLEYGSNVEEVNEPNTKKHVGTSKDEIQPLLHDENLSAGHPLILKQSAECSSKCKISYNNLKVCGQFLRLEPLLFSLSFT